MQKGGTIGLLLVVFGILVVTIGGGYWLWNEDPEAERAPTPLVEVREEEKPAGEKNVRATRSFVILDNAIAYTSSMVYYRSGTDTDGEPLYTALRDADPDTFKKVGTVEPSTQVPLAGAPPKASGPQTVYLFGQGGGAQTVVGSGSSFVAGTSYSITFYADARTVYMTIESGGQASTPQIVVGADPATFQILTAEYSKDGNHVFVVVVTCTGGVCSATVQIVPNADPNTFQAFPNPTRVLSSDCSTYITADAQDANYVFNNGQVVDGISVYLIGTLGTCDDTPQLISP